MQIIFESSGFYFSESFIFRLVDSSTDTGLRITILSGAMSKQLVVYTEARPPSIYQTLFELIMKTRY